MATTDWELFATGATPNVISQAAWAALAARATGFESGTAASNQINKLLRQAQFIACVIANFELNQLQVDINDDGNLSAAITNFQNAILALTTNAPFSVLASAATTDLGTVASRNVNISGSVSISSFGSSASTSAPLYFLDFSGSPLLVESSNLLLPGRQSLQTYSGDAGLAQYLGSGVWQLLAYWPAAAARPSGEMTMYAGTVVPQGWLECNGASLSTAAYPALFANIGYSYGGAGANFNIPDMRGYFPRGWNHGAGGNPDSGRALGGTPQTDAFQGHTFAAGGDQSQLLDQAATNNISSVTGSSGTTTTEYRNNANLVDRAVIVSDGTNGAPRTAAETRPVNVSVMFIIKT